MNVIREIEKGIDICEYVLNNDVQNAKIYKDKYRKEIQVYIDCNEAYMKEKTEELMYCINVRNDLEQTLKNTSKWSFIIRMMTKMDLAHIKRRISKVDKEIVRLCAAGERLEKISCRFDGFIYLA